MASAKAPELHWAASLIGKPHRLGARGPAEFDCWAVPQFCWRERRGIEVPDVGAEAVRLAQRVRAFETCGFGTIDAFEVDRPRELDAVYMTNRTAAHHIGLWIEPDRAGGVLHSVEGRGVVFQRRADLAVNGFAIVKFMRLGALA